MSRPILIVALCAVLVGCTALAPPAQKPSPVAAPVVGAPPPTNASIQKEDPFSVPPAPTLPLQFAPSITYDTSLRWTSSGLLVPLHRDEFLLAGMRFFTFNRSNWTISGGVIEPDNATEYAGHPSLRVTSQPETPRIVMERRLPHPVDLSNASFSLSVRLDVCQASFFEPRLVLVDQTGNETRLEATVHPNQTGDWLGLDLGPGNEPFMRANLSSIVTIRLIVVTGGAEVAFHLGEVRLLPVSSKGYLLLTFDDDLASQATVVEPAMDAHGFRGTLFVNSRTVGTRSHLTLDQLRAFNASGWDVANHGAGHIDYSSMPAADQEADAREGKQFLLDHGFLAGADFFRAPFSRLGNGSLGAISPYAAMIISGGGIGGTGPFLSDPYHVPAMDADNLTLAEAEIDLATQHHLVLILTQHDHRDPQEYGAFLDFIKARVDAGGLEVITVNQLYANLRATAASG